MTEETDFSGAKIALICEGRLVVYRRDMKPGIPWPGMLDLPGGGREGEETPEACALREVEEEFGLRLSPALVVWRRAYAATAPHGRFGWFLVAHVGADVIAAVRFGEEGQGWEMMEIDRFLVHDEAIPHLRERLGHYLRE